MTVRPAVAILCLIALAVAGCARGTGPAPSGGTDGSASAGPGSASADGEAVRVVAVGDIACKPGGRRTDTTCQHAATAELAAALEPDLVLALGDLQYEAGRKREFAAYDATWGALLPITETVPGNHEYYSKNAAGYFAYTGVERPGWRTVDAGAWRIYLLDANCRHVDCRAEEAWFDQDLAENPQRCSLMALHYPRFSSGSEHGSDASMETFWSVAYAHRLDVALAGHEHDYERFEALTPSGDPAPGRGITSFVSGAGGRSLYELGEPVPGSAFAEDTRFGVLVLTLRSRGYDWEFHTIDGEVLDSGSAACV